MGPLTGYRVVELGVWVAGPAAAGLLADWGADVVKIEPPAGDPMRGVFRVTAGRDDPRNPPFDLDNRGKRSVVLDLRSDDGRELGMRLVERADVLVTNLRPDALERIGFDHAALRERFPRLVYCSITGYGLEGADRSRAGYDIGAFWARSGMASLHTLPDDAPLPNRGGLGDHVTGLAALSGILAALLERERTGQGRLVETSLLRTGMYTLGWDLNIQLAYGKLEGPVARTERRTPLINCYRASDGGWFWLLGLEGDRHFPGVARAVERPDLLDDERFATARERARHASALVAELDAAFATATRDEWAARFAEHDVWWAPVQTPAEVVADPQAVAAGAFVDVPDGAGGTTRHVAGPVGFGTPLAPGPVPALGQHTDEVLRELGVEDREADRLRQAGVVPGR